jgi:TolB protein
MKIRPLRKIYPYLLSGLFAGQLAWAGEDELDITKWLTGARLIPISLSGFTGEAAVVLKSDLEIVGFTNVPPDQAQYILSGSNNGQVEGRLNDRISKTSLLAKAYTGGTSRSQAHALADDVVLAITRRKGIAQTKIAFKVDTGPNSEIYIADYDGHNAVAVTRDNSIVAAPCWAPGKRVLYYTSYKANNPDVYFHDLSSGTRKPIARYSGLNTSAAVSPDGARVALILSKSGSPDVFVCAADDGGNLKQLTRTREDESSPCWSPDGRFICYVAREGRPTLYVMSADGGAKRKVTTDIANATEPDWSPDGKTIAFTTQRGAGVFEICTVAATGGASTALAQGEDPSWAPNSRTLIFARRKGGRRTLSLLDVPTKHVKDVAPVTGSCSQPSWAK